MEPGMMYFLTEQRKKELRSYLKHQNSQNHRVLVAEIMLEDDVPILPPTLLGEFPRDQFQPGPGTSPFRCSTNQGLGILLGCPRKIEKD